MSRSDVVLDNEYAGESFRADIESGSYMDVLDEWGDNRMEDKQKLESAHDDEDSSFRWENIDIVEENRGRDRGDELVPVTGVEPNGESEVYDLAREFAVQYLKAVIAEIRRIQGDTSYSPREFVVLVLLSADNVSEEKAASLMDITVGNYRGKVGTVREKREVAQYTAKISNHLES